MSLERNPETPLSPLFGVGGGTHDSGAERWDRDREQAQGGRDKDKAGGSRQSATWPGCRLPAYNLQGMDVRNSGSTRLGSSHSPPLAMSELSSKAKTQGQAPQDFKSVTQQPSLTLEGGTTGPSMPGPRSGSKAGRDRESQCLRINGFFYFYRCLCQWVEGTWGRSRTLLVPAASLLWGKAASKSNSIWKAKLPENTVGAALRTGGNKNRGEARPTEPTTA